jgi:hypothetical protein
VQIGDVPDLLAKPAAHLASRIGCDERGVIELPVEVVQQLLAAAEVPPCVLHARIEAEWHRGAEREGRVLADEQIGCGFAHLDGAALDRVGRIEPRHDLAGREHLDAKLVVGRLRHRLGELLGGPEYRVERFRKARRQAPLELRHRLRNGGLRDRTGCKAGTGRSQKLATFHAVSPRAMEIGGLAQQKWFDRRLQQALPPGDGILAAF